MKILKKGDFVSNRVHEIPVENIRPNPQQPRKQFSQEGLEELAQSIRAYGILQPLTVRCIGRDYQLIAGERRLRAAKLAGLRQVPCLIAAVGEEDAGMLALIENLQRRDLDCFEEAAAIAELIRRYGINQEQAAKKLGKSQSAVANKLRLLRLPEDIRRTLQENELTERHARALLRITDAELQRYAVRAIISGKMNVAQTEEYIEKLLRTHRTEATKGKTTYIIKDVRLFLNSLEHQMGIMRRAGVAADMGRCDTEDAIILTIRIPHTSEKVGADC